ncbi:MAG TPA: hypothetical protein VMR18_03295 [Candidatus Saccharimonadales bacterium]|nr:hypothetical protein [Candidatus Saccharimonadales bacterium]
MAINNIMQGTITNRITRVAALGFVLFAAIFILSTKTTYAASGNGFIVSPVREELTVKKGQSVSIQMSVQNPTTAPLTAEPVVNDFEANPNESGVPDLLLNNKPPFPVNDFRSLVLPLNNLSLKPGQKVYFLVTISVPANGASGGYYGAIRFVPTSTNISGGNVGLTASVGTLFLITVPGHLVEHLSIVQLASVNSSGTPESVFFGGDVSLMNRIDNTGNIHLAPYGSVQVKNMEGHEVYHYNFNSTQGNILPDSVRKFVDPLSYKGWLGHYTVSEYLAWSQGSGNILYASTSFWYFPIWFVILVLVIVALIIVWVVRKNKKKQKRQAAKSPKT